MVDMRTNPAEVNEPLKRTTLARAFRVAFAGLGYALRTQRNLQIHAVITLAVVIVGAALQFSPLEWAAVVLCIGMTWSAELLNTAIEVLVDLLSPEYHERAGVAKDVAAAGVLMAAIASAIVGVIIVGQRLLG